MKTANTKGSLPRLRELLTKADLHVDDRDSEYYEIDAQDLQQALRDLDALMASVPDGLEFAVTEIKPRQEGVLREEICVMMNAAKILHEAMEE